MTYLRDVIYDTLENIDCCSSFLSNSRRSTYQSMHLQALLRVLKVLACRALPSPGIDSILAADPTGKYTGTTRRWNSTYSTLSQSAGTATVWTIRP
jgi:hypothetical protein